MRQLLLLRHAEAQAVRSGQTDAQRNLTDPGRLAAAQAAQRLRRHGLRPDAMLISPAARTRQTAQIVAEELGLSCEPRYDAALYPGGIDALWAALRGSPETAHCLLLVGHNPGLSVLVQQLAALAQQSAAPAQQPAGDGAPHSAGEPRELSTAGLCRIDLDAPSWQDIGVGTVRSVSMLQ